MDLKEIQPLAVVKGVLFASYNDTNDVIAMILNDTWLVPEPSEYFIIPNNTELEVSPGIYKINLSGIVSGVDTTHGGCFYLKDSTEAAIKDLTFELSMGNIKQNVFWKSNPI